MAQDSPNKSTPAADLPDARQLERITDFFHEAGHLRHTPRSGYAFLGSGSENVAEHSYRTSVIGYTLAKLAGADAARVTFLCLFHDLHEARTGDFNYVNHRYDTCRDREALQDAVDGTGLEQDILDGWDEWQERRSLEARLAHDADQLDLICNLKAELDKGNKFAADWLESAVKRLRRPRPCARSSCARTTTAGGTAAWTKHGGSTASRMPAPALSGAIPLATTQQPGLDGGRAAFCHRTGCTVLSGRLSPVRPAHDRKRGHPPARRRICHPARKKKGSTPQGP